MTPPSDSETELRDAVALAIAHAEGELDGTTYRLDATFVLDELRRRGCWLPGSDAHRLIAQLTEQRPEKPDYWTECSQCRSNIDAADELIDAMNANLGDKSGAG